MSPAATHAEAGDSSDLTLAIDDADLSALILRLQQGVVERSESIGSRWAGRRKSLARDGNHAAS
jgi:hypothetical protein